MWWFAGSGIAGERVSCGLQGQLQSIQSVQSVCGRCCGCCGCWLAGCIGWGLIGRWSTSVRAPPLSPTINSLLTSPRHLSCNIHSTLSPSHFKPHHYN